MKTDLFKLALVLAALWFVIISFLCLMLFLTLEALDGDASNRLQHFIEIGLVFVFVGLGPLLTIFLLIKWKGIKLRESITSLRLNDKETSSTSENVREKGVSKSA
ncbi:MAG: hypothetical protein JST85_10775 [Acidobacteria bacterium]|nr:hypothetical protein [Acidobacteriota bacterium]